MSERHTVLLLGSTGRTGGRVLRQLLDRGVAVRAIVRSTARLPEGVASEPLLTVIEADLLSLTTEELRRHLEICMWGCMWGWVLHFNTRICWKTIALSKRSHGYSR